MKNFENAKTEILISKERLSETYKGYLLLPKSKNVYIVCGNPVLVGTKLSIIQCLNVISGSVPYCMIFNELLSSISEDKSAIKELISLSINENQNFEQYYKKIGFTSSMKYIHVWVLFNLNNDYYLQLYNTINLKVNDISGLKIETNNNLASITFETKNKDIFLENSKNISDILNIRYLDGINLVAS